MLFLHPRVLVLNFPACFRFYRNVLQLRPVWGNEAETYASFSNGAEARVVLAIFQRQHMAAVLGTDHQPLNPAGQDVHMLIFSVEDVDAEVQRLKQLGIAIEKEPANYPDWGFRGAYLRDPDGNLIELSGALPEEEWTEELRQANEQYRV